MTAARTIDAVFVYRASGGDSTMSPPPVGVPVADIAGLPTPTELPELIAGAAMGERSCVGRF
jgi:hypothetical protein